MVKQEYDIIIIGAGPAGLTAGLYAARSGLRVLSLEKAQSGGQLLWTEIIENLPGFPEGITGQEFGERLKTQALQSGLTIVSEAVKQISLVQSTKPCDLYNVKTEKGDYLTYSIILASGAYPKRLGVPREEEFTGKGVSYCAICDAPLFRQREIMVIGGGNAACEEALYLSKFASRVTLIHRRNRLRADKILQDKLKAHPKIDFIWNSQVTEIWGEKLVCGVKIKDVHTGKIRDVSCTGVFIFVGLKPSTDFLQGQLKLDDRGFVVTDENLATSQKGIFACGDCRARALYQIVTACSEGAQAAKAARDYVEKLKGTDYA